MTAEIMEISYYRYKWQQSVPTSLFWKFNIYMCINIIHYNIRSVLSNNLNMKYCNGFLIFTYEKAQVYKSDMAHLHSVIASIKSSH